MSSRHWGWSGTGRDSLHWWLRLFIVSSPSRGHTVSPINQPVTPGTWRNSHVCAEYIMCHLPLKSCKVHRHVLGDAALLHCTFYFHCKNPYLISQCGKDVILFFYVYKVSVTVWRLSFCFFSRLSERQAGKGFCLELSEWILSNLTSNWAWNQN